MEHPYHQVLDALFPPGLPRHTNTWAIVDAARDDRIYGAVYGCHLEKCCLYSGDLPWQLQMTAPYLVQLESNDSFTRYLIREGWGRAWGLFFRSDAGIQELRRHLRGFLRVRDESGKRMIFRYYDPRVLRAYLPTCLPSELRILFGPITRYLLESPDSAVMLDFGFDGAKLIEDRVLLQQQTARAMI